MSVRFGRPTPPPEENTMPSITRKSSVAPVEPSTPAEPIAPPSKLARAQVVLEATDEAMRQVVSEIATLQERQRKTERELSEVDGHNAVAESDIRARLDRRVALQQELTATR